jgi:catechol-2,3-dioxygenase
MRLAASITLTPPHVGHIAKVTSDPHRLAEFYRDLLDLQIMREASNQTMGDAVLLSGRPKDEDHELVFVTKPEAIHTAFRVDNLDILRAFYNRGRASGIEVPYALDTGVARGLFVRDPDGNAIEIYAALDGQRREAPPVADPDAIDRPIAGS